MAALLLVIAPVARPASAGGSAIDVLDANESPEGGIHRSARQRREQEEKAPRERPDIDPRAVDEAPVPKVQAVEFAQPAPPFGGPERGWERHEGGNGHDKEDKVKEKEEPRDKGDKGEKHGKKGKGGD